MIPIIDPGIYRDYLFTEIHTAYLFIIKTAVWII